MKAPVAMPKLGLTMVEGTVTRWLRQPGEPVLKGEVIVEVTTEKITAEVEAPAAGVLGAHLVPEGATAPVGEILAYIAAGDAEPASPEPDPARFVPASPYARAQARLLNLDLSQASPTGPRGMVVARDLAALRAQSGPGQAEEPRPKATPLAERIAARSGLDLAGLPVEGRIRKADVTAAVQGRESGRPTSPEPGPAPRPAPGPAGTPRREPLSPIRKAIARRMTGSYQTAPHVTLHTDAPVDGLLALRTDLNETLPDDAQLTLTDLLVAVTARALSEFPHLNASLEGEEILLWPEVHIGLAVALDEGLIVPVIRGAGGLSLRQIAGTRRDLVSRAREGRLAPEEVSGSTFTISNLGAYGIDGFTPIINPPEAAILGVGRVQERPVRQGSDWVPRRFLTLSLSFDHRIIDGAQGARFLQRVTALIERPSLLLL